MTINVILPPVDNHYRIDEGSIRLEPGMTVGTITVHDMWAVRINGNKVLVVDYDGVSITETGTVL